MIPEGRDEGGANAALDGPLAGGIDNNHDAVLDLPRLAGDGGLDKASDRQNLDLARDIFGDGCVLRRMRGNLLNLAGDLGQRLACAHRHLQVDDGARPIL